MGIKAVLENIDGLEESLAALYVKNDETGKYTLDVEGGIPDVTALVKALGNERDSVKDYKNKIKQYDGIDPVKAREALDKIAVGINEATNSDARARALEETLNNERKERDALAVKLDSMLIDAALKDSRFLDKVSKDPAHRLLAVKDARSNFRVEDGRVVAYDDNGECIRDSMGNIASVADAHERIIMSRSYADAILAGSTANGSGATTINTRTSNVVNPWMQATESHTEQQKLLDQNPMLAARLKQEAGILT